MNLCTNVFTHDSLQRNNVYIQHESYNDEKVNPANILTILIPWLVSSPNSY